MADFFYNGNLKKLSLSLPPPLPPPPRDGNSGNQGEEEMLLSHLSPAGMKLLSLRSVLVHPAGLGREAFLVNELKKGQPGQVPFWAQGFVDSWISRIHWSNSPVLDSEPPGGHCAHTPLGWCPDGRLCLGRRARPSRHVLLLGVTDLQSPWKIRALSPALVAFA